MSVDVLNDASLGMLFEDLKNQIREEMAKKRSCHFMIIYDANTGTLSMPLKLGIPDNVVQVVGSKWKLKK